MYVWMYIHILHMESHTYVLNTMEHVLKTTCPKWPLLNYLTHNLNYTDPPLYEDHLSTETIFSWSARRSVYVYSFTISCTYVSCGKGVHTYVHTYLCHTPARAHTHTHTHTYCVCVCVCVCVCIILYPYYVYILIKYKHNMGVHIICTYIHMIAYVRR